MKLRSRRSIRSAFIFLLVMISYVMPPAVAIDENEDYTNRFWNHVWPYFQTGEFGECEGTGGVRLAYAVFKVEDERGALVFLPGKSETYLKYAELIYDLRHTGYSIYVLDHRGMGFSDHLVDDDPDKVFVNSFEEYVDDLDLFLRQIVTIEDHPRLILSAHSMGGAIALRYLQRYPGRFDGAVLNAPMLRIDTGSTPEWLAFSVSSCLGWFGLGKKYAFGYGPWEQGTFETNELTHSRARWSIWWEQLVPKFPIVESDGPTYRWVRECIQATKTIRRDAALIDIPILMFQAEEDVMVRPGGQNEFSERAPNCRIHLFRGAYHEIFIEKDDIRNPALELMIEFLNK